MSPICWDDVGERRLLGLEIVLVTVKKVHLIRGYLQAAQSRQKSYADNRRKSLAFQVEDHVFLRIACTKGVIRLNVRGKLNPRYIGPSEILERSGDVAYRLTLPLALPRVRKVFHFCMLIKFIANPEYVIQLPTLSLTMR